MRQSAGNFVLSVVSGVGGYTSIVVSHFNAIVGLLIGLFSLIGAAFAAINGYYTWHNNRKAAAREAETERQRQANDNSVTAADEHYRSEVERQFRK